MIFVDRSRVPVPRVLASPQAKVERERARKFFSRDRARRAQERFAFQSDLLRKCAPDLRKLFRAKCAYCESVLKKGEEHLVDQFRPAAHAKEVDGKSAPDHYWWLAYEWDNLYPVCAACSKAKATMFPVRGKRINEGAYGKELLKEKSVLLNPCVDRPEQFLHFFDDGRVVPAVAPAPHGRQIDAHRATATIEILALNRKELVEARSQAMEEVTVACHALAKRSNRLVAGSGAAMSHPARRVKDLFKPWYSYVAARRQAAQQALRSMGDFGKQLITLIPELRDSADIPQAREVKLSAPRRRRTGYVAKLAISNFKAIEKLELNFQPEASFLSTEISAPDGKTTGETSVPVQLTPLKADWKVLLGENGAGKTSILQAAALALAGEREVSQRLLNWDKILRRARGKRRRPKEGFVKITLTTGDDIEFRFTRRKASFTAGAEGSRTYLRGYGPTRNLPNTRAPASWKSVHSTVRIVNLFDPNSPLCSAERWLAGLHKKRFDVVALALKDVLRLDPSDHIRRTGRRETYGSSARIVVDIGKATVGLDELSDGYQSMVALAIDIMAGLSEKSTDYQSETGIVLLDELGNHLHPRWRMDVVRSLQRAFPRLQFISTTHEPLCLRGLNKSEVAVLRRIDRRIVKVDDDELPDPAAMRIDQLLTSRYFGLESTVDPDIDRQFQEYYLLLGKRPLSNTERSRLKQLKVELNRQPRALGYTRRDQLVYEVIDQYLASELRTSGSEQIRRLREATKKKVVDIFRRVKLLHEVA